MATKSRIQIARPDILRFFDELPPKIHRKADLARYLAEQRSFWRLTQETTAARFIDFLLQSTRLRKIEFPFPPPYRRDTRYVWGDVPLYEVMLTLKPGSYFTHYTAVYLHGLTEQVPKTTYLNHEQALASTSTGELSQKNIDAAFKRPVRVSGNVAETKQFRLCVISGKNTGNLGVIEEERSDASGHRLGRLRFTGVERTLIDIAVRPVYAGGAFEVLKAYRLAKDVVSVNRLAAMLKKLDYIYPYHQVIGFLLERAGYKASAVDLLRRFPQEFDFYLMHNMAQTEYVPQWRLHIPKGF
jgi:hypothetical protein